MRSVLLSALWMLNSKEVSLSVVDAFTTPPSVSSFSTVATTTTNSIVLGVSSRTDEEEDTVVTTIDINSTPNGSSSSSSGVKSRFSDLLSAVGLDQGQLRHVPDLPALRQVTPNDVFCNRELKMSGIQAIGFDMDYTLAQYQQPAFDQLAFDGAKQKLVEKLGYPEEVLDFEYNHEHWTRGLIIDTQRGNFLKIDRHKYVRVAHHGFDRISSTTRKHLYSGAFNKVPSFSEKSYVNMDTLFQFVDAHLFASLIDMKDKGEHEVLDYKTYAEMYRQVRECVDLCHRDGVIKDEVARNPEEYIVLDKGLIPMLQRYRQAGVKVFILTNSLWEYTSTAMNYLYHGKKVDDETLARNEWLELFDLAIVGSCKPAYMLDPYLNLFRVNPADGTLQNTDGCFEIEALGENGAQKFLAQGKTFQGGNWLHLHSMLEINAGEEILYVGDHLYADVLRSKRTLGWRSCFVMPELEDEMLQFSQSKQLAHNITELRRLMEELTVYKEDILRRQSTHTTTTTTTTDILNGEDTVIAELDQDLMVIKSTLKAMTNSWHRSFHPVWGAMFNAGYTDSRFAFYVNNYACLYTSRATNLGLASTSRSFRTSLEILPHDRLLTDAQYVQDQEPWEDV
ncbi:Cytosolic purine 5'-nucleotidase [Seminavis robusta]|uniref:Cytosolic purine 5'-nucleotidase n=1 Tax=Seminavis robusta TaxID=568900 RepID=A0A9N8F0L9_9STRA|nr:Cytosolic purine 5'-nucleotidase [Seminavis robusta]|eukprot:Sro3607_g349650.1 Cytosolic purine 5'-nucleotidase (621) ;mRNA; r:945-3022